MKQRFYSSIRFPLTIVFVLWIIHLFSVLLNLELGRYGLYPREWSGIKGIFLSPFIHGSFNHLISNSFPILFLGFLMVFFYRKIALSSILLISLLTGIGVWLFGRGVYHIGASGVIYGMVTFIFWMGIFRRDVKSIVLALIVTLLYSGYFYGILPVKEGISWESHLIGAIVGILVAFLFKNTAQEIKEESIEIEEEDYYLPRDTFDYPYNQMN